MPSIRLLGVPCFQFSRLWCRSCAVRQFPASAQTTTLGTISGIVTDQTNAVVPDATVTIKDTATGEVRTGSSNSAGRYIFVNVNPGIYDIKVIKHGFAKTSIPGQVVQIGQVSTNKVTLKVGSPERND